MTTLAQRPTPGAWLSPAQLRSAFGAFPTGITVVGALVEGRPVGLVASSFTSVSLDPPLVSLAFGHASTSWVRLTGAPRLGISVLAAHQAGLVARLSRPAPERFAGVRWSAGEHGGLTIDGAAATFDVGRHSEVVAGDHTVAFLRVFDLEHHRVRTPLVFHHSGLRRLAGEPGTP